MAAPDPCDSPPRPACRCKSFRLERKSTSNLAETKQLVCGPKVSRVIGRQARRIKPKLARNTSRLPSVNRRADLVSNRRQARSRLHVTVMLVFVILMLVVIRQPTEGCHLSLSPPDVKVKPSGDIIPVVAPLFGRRRTFCSGADLVSLSPEDKAN